jgi:6-phosphogluconolactonase
VERRRVIFTRFADAAAAGEALALQVAGLLREGMSVRGTGSVAVPGGRTPVPLFRALREQVLDWSRISVTLTDERWVSESHPASNAALLRAELLQGQVAAARFFPLFDGSASAAAARAPVWAALQLLPRPFDAIVLGMGEDGHFASLFAGNDGLSVALDPRAAPACVAMQAPGEPRERLSLNLPALLQTRRLMLLATGQAKRERLEAARRESPEKLPVAALLALRQPKVEVYWAP